MKTIIILILLLLVNDDYPRLISNQEIKRDNYIEVIRLYQFYEIDYHVKYNTKSFVQPKYYVPNEVIITLNVTYKGKTKMYEVRGYVFNEFLKNPIDKE
jgi:hypothetical protein